MVCLLSSARLCACLLVGVKLPAPDRKAGSNSVADKPPDAVVEWSAGGKRCRAQTQEWKKQQRRLPEITERSSAPCTGLKRPWRLRLPAGNRPGSIARGRRLSAWRSEER